MKMDVIRQPLSLTLVLFGLLAALFCARFTVWPLPGESAVIGGMPLEALLGRFSANFPLLSLGISTLLVFYNGLALSRTISRHMVLTSRAYIPITLYLIVSCGIWMSGANLAAAIAAFLFVRATEFLLSSYVRHHTFDATFKGAFLVGMMPLIYPPAAVYFVLIPLGLSIFKRSPREIITSIAGGLLPVLIYAYVMWVLDYGFIQTFVSFADRLNIPAELPAIGFGSVHGIIKFVCLGLVILLTLLGLIGFAISSGKMRTRARTILVYFVIVLIIGSASFFIPSTGIGAIALLAVPVSMIIPVAFSQFSGWITGALYITLLSGIVVLNIYPFLFA